MRNGQALQLAQHRGHGEDTCLKIANQMRLYRQGAAPYGAPVGGKGYKAATWWDGVAKPTEINELRSAVVLPLLETKPSAVDPETNFSAAGFQKSKRRNRLAVATLTTLTAIQLHHTRYC